jgi:3-hydroxyisobutyrate dehydrogenase-like beta-hydroxyacid dehydrogenase
VATIGVLHPGEMGSAVAGALLSAGHDVVWAGAGRSAATRARAENAALRDVGDLAGVCERAGVVVSVCPPESALEMAERVASSSFGGVYVDANAVSPSTARRIDAAVRAGGASYVDGGIIGGPSAPRVYLSGDQASVVASLFGPPVTVAVLAEGPYSASAVKMLYAGWTKGTIALLLALGAAAENLGVADELTREWQRSQPGLVDRLTAGAGSARKAWRWTGEMREIARTLADAGLPGEFHTGAADVFTRLVALKDVDEVTLDEVVRRLRDG